MNDLKEIGGYIISGETLVYADSATMTGQGTVVEPFGVKNTDLFVQEPLYTGVSGNSAYIGWRPDETVLWSGNVTGSAFSITLNEDSQNFESVRFVGQTNNGAGWPMNGFVCTDDTRDGTKIECSMTAQDPSYFKVTVMELSGNNLKGVQMFEKNMLSANAPGASRNDFHITKVIGINRKV